MSVTSGRPTPGGSGRRSEVFAAPRSLHTDVLADDRRGAVPDRAEKGKGWQNTAEAAANPRTKGGRAMRYCRIKDVMTREVVCVEGETPFKQVALLLSDNRISGLPVVDDEEKVVGVISETDLLQRQAQQVEGHGRRYVRRLRLTRSARTAAAKARATTADHLMSRPAITATPDDYVTEAAQLMRNHRVERLPVVDDMGRLVGIVTRGDLLRVFLRTDEDIRREVTRRVAQGLDVPRYVVDVRIDAGVVTLRGHLERRDDVELAARIAGHVDGVVAVTNRLTHRPNSARPRSVLETSSHM